MAIAATPPVASIRSESTGSPPGETPQTTPVSALDTSRPAKVATPRRRSQRLADRYRPSPDSKARRPGSARLRVTVRRVGAPSLRWTSKGAEARATICDRRSQSQYVRRGRRVGCSNTAPRCSSLNRRLRQHRAASLGDTLHQRRDSQTDQRSPCAAMCHSTARIEFLL